MVQGPSWKADRCPSGQEITQLDMEHEVYYHVYNSLPLQLIPS
jgi:hypothetical protein